MAALQVQAGLAGKSLSCTSKAGRLLPQHFLSRQIKFYLFVCFSNVAGALLRKTSPSCAKGTDDEKSL